MQEKIDYLYFDEKACEEIANEMNGKPFVFGKLSVNIGVCDGKVETSTLPDEPEIYADNEEDREMLRSCYHE